MFFLSKVLALFTQPLGWVATLLVLALFQRRQHAQRAKRLTFSALLLLLLIGWEPLPDMLLRHLETQYAEIAPDADLRNYAGVVVLGGATESGWVAEAHSQPLITDGGERLTATVAMLQRHPHLRFVYTGGEGMLLGSGPSEADRARKFFESLGATGPRMQYEAQSRNTYDNAIMAAAMPGIDIQKPWLLVTSAWHMPRSMGVFKKAGWNITAYPVDFRTSDSTPWTSYSLTYGPQRWQIGLHELLGLVSYRITGRL